MKPVLHQMQLLTHSRMSCARRCLREHYYRYELGIVRDIEAQYFKVGHAIHEALRVWHSTGNTNRTVAALALDDPYNQMMAITLIEAYIERTEPLEFESVETQFELPLINPDTNAPSRTFVLAGKIDGLTADAVVEHKTTSEDIAPDSEYWARLRVDPQISLYALASGRNTVLYNVIRKPSIRPRQVPLLDNEGVKVVIDDATGERVQNKNGTWKQAATDGCTLQTRPETPEEFGTRLHDDIDMRPDFYFARREIPILSDHMEEFKAEVWQQAKLLMKCQRSGYWFRNVSRVTCGNCQYANICLQSITVTPDSLPSGYVRSEPHQELFNVETA